MTINFNTSITNRCKIFSNTSRNISERNHEYSNYAVFVFRRSWQIFPACLLDVNDKHSVGKCSVNNIIQGGNNPTFHGIVIPVLREIRNRWNHLNVLSIMCWKLNINVHGKVTFSWKETRKQVNTDISFRLIFLSWLVFTLSQHRFCLFFFKYFWQHSSYLHFFLFPTLKSDVG